MAGKTHIEPALLEQYLLGITTMEENRAVEVYLAHNPAVAKEIKDSQSALEDFAMEYAIKPPKKLKGKVLDAIKSTFLKFYSLNK